MKRIEKIAFVVASVIAAAAFSGCDKNKSAGGETASEAEQTFVVGTMITKPEILMTISNSAATSLL